MGKRRQMRIGILLDQAEELRNKHGDYDDMLRRFLGGRGFGFVTYHASPRVFVMQNGWLITVRSLVSTRTAHGSRPSRIFFATPMLKPCQ
jgi:hypothetical protein